MAAIIYLITNTVNGKQYIGKTVQSLNERWGAHCRAANKGVSTYLHRAIQKYGRDAFTQQIWEEATVETLNDREIYWIAKISPAYNMTKGGEGTNGWCPSREWRDHQSRTRRGEKSPMYGKKLTEETRKKISASLKGKMTKEKNPMFGKTSSKETRNKMRNSHLNKKHSAETRKKMSEAAKLRWKNSQKTHIDDNSESSDLFHQ